MSFGACFAPVRRAESGVHASANTSPIAGWAPLGPATCSSSLTTKDVQFTISLTNCFRLSSTPVKVLISNCITNSSGYLIFVDRD
jgi:hypothetical protein